MLTCNFKGEKVEANEENASWLREVSRNGDLVCNECQTKVIFRQGTYRPHFYHYRRKKCSLSLESEEHNLGKLFIRDILRKQYPKEHIHLEETIESDQRADVLLDVPKRRFAFEIQFSPQTDEQWKERISKFQAADVTPVWILGYRKSIFELLKKTPYLIERKQNYHPHIIINLGRAKQNASHSLVSDKETFYMSKKFPNREIFHILTVVDGKCEFYMGYLRPRSKTIFYGSLVRVDENWIFNEYLSRFMSPTEIQYNALEEKKIAETQNRSNLRIELNKRILQYTKCNFLHEIPEIAIQSKRMNLPNLVIFASKSSANDVPERLLAEIAIYLKFVKSKPKRFSFNFLDDILPFLKKWGLVIPERKHELFAQLGYFLDKLCAAGILVDENHSGEWIVTGKRIITT